MGNDLKKTDVTQQQQSNQSAEKTDVNQQQTNQSADVSQQQQPNQPAEQSDTPKEEQEPTGESQPETIREEQEQAEQTQLANFADIKDGLKTGDLLILYRHKAETPNYGVTKPMHKDSFRKKRYLTAVTAVERIFYGDYEKVAVCRIQCHGIPTLWANQALELLEIFESLNYSDEEIKMIEEAESPEICSTLTAVLNLSLFLHKLGVLEKNVSDVRPVLNKWHTTLPMSKPEFINVPPVKPGPIKKGDPPFHQKLLRGLEKTHKPYHAIKDSLNTGDVILLSTVGTSGFLIKLGSNSQFSHAGLVLKPKGTTMLMVWEAVSNTVGIVDLESVEVNAGTQVVPLKHKILNGYNDEVAIRRLVDVTDEQREIIQEKMMKLTKENEGKKYEKNLLKMVQAELDFDEDFITFLKSDKEDTSTLFCSELVACAYQEAGLLGKETPADEYTPDDFSSKKDLQLKYGRLEPEIYIQLKYDD